MMIDKRVKYKVNGVVSEGTIVDESDDFVFIHPADIWISKLDVLEIIK